MTKEIHIVRDIYALVDDEDYELLSSLKWHIHSAGYAVRNAPRIKGKPQSTIYMHRLILNAPEDKVIDHINGEKLDNRRCNLRICTQSQNSKNQRKGNKKYTSKYKGVYYSERDRKWKGTMCIDRKSYNLGTFITQEGAAMAYNERALSAFGEFASLNIIDMA